LASNYKFCLLPLLVLLVCPGAAAGEIKHADVRHSKGIYHLDLEVIIDAGIETTYAIVTDYDQLDRLSDLLINSSLVAAPEEGQKQLSLLARTCILIFCFNVRVVNELRETGTHTILTTIIPAQSDFKSGTTSWNFQENGSSRSRMHVTGQVEPAFWIPPVIGPILIKRKIIRETRKIIEQIELLAKDA